MKKNAYSHLITIILAAGESKRMGESKLLLPWGGQPMLARVIEQVSVLDGADVVVVVGGYQEQIRLLMSTYPIRPVTNPDYKMGEMLSSIQAGLRAASQEAEIALVVLGDQPQIQSDTVKALVKHYEESGAALIVPSYQNRRGHPWLIHRMYWPEILKMPPNQSMRDFFRQHTSEIHYCLINNASILLDVDTPDDYQRMRPAPDLKKNGPEE